MEGKCAGRRILIKLFGEYISKNEVLKRFGNISQFAGIKSYTFNNGRAKGTDAFDVKTGSGLYFTVLPGRAMDIAWMECKGIPVSYMTKSGITAPEYYDPAGFEWLRGFYGGLLTTCGLTQAGEPGTDGIWELGQHGRISNTPAEETGHKTEWIGDDLVMTMEGKMREAVLYEENLLLTRRITAMAGENKLLIDDEIENQGHQETPFMLLYHINLGYPVVSEDSEFIANIKSTTAMDKITEAGIADFRNFSAPDPLAQAEVFMHDMIAQEDGTVVAGVINRKLKFGFYLKYNKNELPMFSQWKNAGQQDYVMALEPGNCTPIGRVEAREKGVLKTLGPGETHTVSIEMGIIDGEEWMKKYFADID